MRLVGWSDDVDPYAVTGDLITGRDGPVGVNDRLWATHLLEIHRAAPGHEMVSAAELLGALRSLKDAEELGVLRRAGAAADATFEEICAGRFAGRTEHEVASDLGRLLVSHGHASADFTIVAGGPNSASPHHEPGERTLREGDSVVMDFGGVLDGYCSDTTRTVSIGEPSDELVRVHEVVKEAQEAGVAAVAPGVPAHEVDRAARRIIADAGYADAFFHRTGHGIGIEVHEHPYIVEGNDEPLRVGTTFSVEPGIYLEGRFGVRIEDIVAVTDDGVERLNLSSRELRVVS
jgi:D-alanyl-D-alanine dipeptidase